MVSAKDLRDMFEEIRSEAGKRASDFASDAKVRDIGKMKLSDFGRRSEPPGIVWLGVGLVFGGLVEHPLEQRVQNAADLRPRRDRELAHDVVAVDREVAQRERVRGGDLLLDALPERLERVHARRARTAADVVRAPQREERRDVVETDGPDEATHGRVGPVGLVPEHVMADEVRDLGDRLLVELPAPQDLTRLELADELVLVEMPVGERVRLPDVVEEAGQSEDEIARRRRVDGRQRVFEDVLRRDLVLRRLL